MKIAERAGKGHLVVGAVLIALSLGSMVATLITGLAWPAALVFFFGVWGGVETGRYLEAMMAHHPQDENQS
jgi:multidrug efflux pump subunit AcrB